MVGGGMGPRWTRRNPCPWGRVKALVWFSLIDETLSANLVYQSDYEIGSTTPSDEAMAKIMTMVMVKCLNLEKKKEKNKRLKAKV